MKQGNVITKIIILILLAFVVTYLGYSVLEAVYDPLTTVTAVSCTAGESYATEIWLVREETPLSSDAYIVDRTLEDGTKVAAGGEVARGYRSDAAFERQQELREKEERLSQLQYAYDAGEQMKFSEATMADLDERIDSGIAALAVSCAEGNLTGAEDQAVSLRTLILRRSASDVEQTILQNSIQALEEEIRQAKEQLADHVDSITVNTTGWFSAACDGYETILTPQALDRAGVSAFETITTAQGTPPDNAIGRLVTSPIWYAAALIPEEYAEVFNRVSTVQLDLTHTLSDMIKMTVESVSAPEDGQRLVVFSCDSYLQNIIHLRSTDAELVTTLYRGLRVPKQAIRLQDGTAGVYVIEGAKAVFKAVHILYDNVDTYVVEEDRSSTDNLWAGDEIIVSARNLYDGKVVKQ